MASVKAHFLSGGSIFLDGCTTVGDIMTRVASDQHRLASDVVVLPLGSDEVMMHDRAPPPEVSIVLKKEESQLDEDECTINIFLHAQAEDVQTVIYALAMLQDVSPGTDWPEDMLLDAARDADKGKIVWTLIRAGVDAGHALGDAARDGDKGAIRSLLAAGANVNLENTDGEGALALACQEGVSTCLSGLAWGFDLFWDFYLTGSNQRVRTCMSGPPR
eukprot:GEMP01062709.1.p1 GENE.GEMP01062709.1~~GEMP01062709.1.p1  ORF type:complete len:218 (+),score=42.97 GEMP01062709.1:145-798(+)